MVTAGAVACAGRASSPADTAAALDVGSYQTAPGPPFGRAGSSRAGQLVEGRRLAAHVAVPVEIDPSLTTAVPELTVTVPDRAAVAAVLGEPAGGLSDTSGLVVGFSSARRSPQRHRQLVNAVLMFATADAATAGASAMRSALAAVARTPGRQPAAPPPDVGATETVVAWTDDGTSTVSGIHTRDRYLMYQSTQAESVAAATDLIHQAVAVQGPRLDQFHPTDPALLADLPVDPEGLLAKTLLVAPAASGNFPAVYGPGAALHFETDPLAAGQAFTFAKVQTVALGKTTIYQAEDTLGASRMARHLRAQWTARGLRATDDVPGLTGAACAQRGPAGDASSWPYACLIAVGRYAVTAHSDQLADAQQQIAAQYRLLNGD